MTERGMSCEAVNSWLTAVQQTFQEINDIRADMDDSKLLTVCQKLIGVSDI
jgi:hypothetical protein